MEANPNKPGVVFNSIDEIIILKDAFALLMDPESLERTRELERKRKQEESGLEIVSIGFSSRDRDHAAIAKGANRLLGMEHYDEILDALQHYEPDQIAQIKPVRYFNENEANLVKFVLGAYAEVTRNEFGKEQATSMIGQIDEKLAESRKQ